MHAITKRQQRIWEQIYTIAFTKHLDGPHSMASDAHVTAVATADNAVGRLIADALPREQMPEVMVDRFLAKGAK